MTVSLKCAGCSADLHPTGRSERARCEYCGADNLLDAATLAALAQAPAPPPGIGMAELLGRLKDGLHDAPAFLEQLHLRLSQALPGSVTVEHSGGFFSKSHLSRVEADLGERRFAFHLEHGRLRGIRSRVVRSVVLKTEELPIAQILDALAAELYELSQRNAETEAALRKLLSDVSA